MLEDLNRIKSFTNSDKEDFSGKYGGRPYNVKVGETIVVTERIAKHLAGQLAYKIANRDFSRPDKEGASFEEKAKELEKTFVGEAQVSFSPKPVETVVEKPVAVEEPAEEFPEVKEIKKRVRKTK